MKLNGNTKWIIFFMTIVFSSGILWNKVNNLEKDIVEVKQDVRALKDCLISENLVAEKS